MKTPCNYNDITLPQPPAHIHLMGICGTGMAALAGMFAERGYKVTGSDEGVYPPMSDFLSSLGINPFQGYRPENLEGKPDCVIVGNVIRRINPEAVAMEEMGLPFMSMADALVRFFAQDKTRIVVTGTHGKTTVSSMIAWILADNGMDPGFFIGGIPKNFQRNYRLGSGNHFVIEGDEYDTAYFDKTPKFLHYSPSISVMTSCEFDHADIYSDVEVIEEQFTKFAGLMGSAGKLIACGSDERVIRIARKSIAPVEFYGLGNGYDWSAGSLEFSDGLIGFSLNHGIHGITEARLPLTGLHNVSNAVAAVAVAQSVGIPVSSAIKSLEKYEGVKRRQDVLGEIAGVLVMDDFAHHPTAVRTTVHGVKARFPQRRLVAVFEPRTNTSRRAVFQQDYVESFGDADQVIIREVARIDAIPEEERFSSAKLAKDLVSKGKIAHYCSTTEEILEILQLCLRPDDVVLIMSNGSFDNLGSRLMEMLKGRGQ